ncbi:MAG: glycosyltransferase family 9 protein [Kiritimatiellae bacterium]|nr:glycosyltransferase family 9 protein [Kiritimatiellia bacterium]
MLFSRTSLLKTIDTLAGPLLCRIFGATTFLIKKNTSSQHIETSNIRKILIIRPGGMGDMIVLLPIIKLIKKHFPEADLELVCEKRNLEAIQIAGLKSVTTAYDSNPVRFIMRLLKKNYDIVIDTEQFHHCSAIFSILSGAPVRIGFNINPKRNPLYTHLINYAPDGPEGMQFMHLIEPLGIKSTDYNLPGCLLDTNTQIPPPPEQLQKFMSSKPFVIIHPGGHTPQKLWHPEKFIELIKGIFSEYDYNIILVGDKADQEIANTIQIGTKESSERIISCCGTLDLAEVAALMKQAEIFIGTDSGLAHLAVALELSSLTLFGPSDHLKWGTSNEKHATVRKSMPCSPCFIFGYHKPCRTLDCMKKINPSDVLAVMNKILS